ncbi:nuclear receptor 2C2-associated protein [Gallus gallus]|uniref:nuclear receptor 2C2-associated protein n=1 Tax=Gallus gallus TaxID=9031 RepID=UPI001F0026B6|nr:nuclear receptor 2C2-associated protein [Gallus gallus]
MPADKHPGMLQRAADHRGGGGGFCHLPQQIGAGMLEHARMLEDAGTLGCAGMPEHAEVPVCSDAPACKDSCTHRTPSLQCLEAAASSRAPPLPPTERDQEGTGPGTALNQPRRGGPHSPELRARAGARRGCWGGSEAFAGSAQGCGPPRPPPSPRAVRDRRGAERSGAGPIRPHGRGGGVSCTGVARGPSHAAMPAEPLVCADTATRVSSVLNRDVKQFGKKHMFDANEETCWNSDQGSCQWVTLDFPRTVRVSQLHIQFQGGFSSRLCTLEGCRTGEELVKISDVYPEDINAMQRFQVEETALDTLKITFENSIDFFGRIVVYHLQVLGERL